VLLPIILDGENAWEHFPYNGRPFLRALYRRLSEASGIDCVTVSEALRLHGGPTQLARLAPGSWISANFDIWLGSPEDNQAWDLLAETRDFFAEHHEAAPPEHRDMAQEELLIAEGSDWCWWYGPEHSTANDQDFDALYRTHLANVYRAFGRRPPDALTQPIAQVRVEAVSVPPSAMLSPQIDGRVSSYFEWMGAGNYRPLTRATTMHGQPPIVKEVYYGRGTTTFFLRIDFFQNQLESIETVSLRLRIRQEPGRAPDEIELRFFRDAGSGEITKTLGGERRVGGTLGQAALKKILELAVSLDSLGLEYDRLFDFQVSVWQEHLPLEVLPLEGWLTVLPSAGPTP
jgi:hypothetical protein